MHKGFVKTGGAREHNGIGAAARKDSMNDGFAPAARFVVALTGGIASGKTAVSDAFAALGASVVDTDVLAREVVLPGSPGLADVVAAFGERVLDATGALDRRALRERVFGDESQRQRLNAILHPRIRALAAERIAAAAGPYVLLVVPLLVESGQYDWVQRVLVVDVDPDTQIQRLVARDGIVEPLARSMLAAQAPREARLAACDEVIANRSDLDSLRQQVRFADRRYRALVALTTSTVSLAASMRGGPE
jgi:dephospho-CoA kinase